MRSTGHASYSSVSCSGWAQASDCERGREGETGRVRGEGGREGGRERGREDERAGERESNREGGSQERVQNGPNAPAVIIQNDTSLKTTHKRRQILHR